jgi:hypothetical protein
MTPTSAAAPVLLPPVGQTHNLDPLQGTPANLGKVTKTGDQALVDSDPLGIDTNVDFSSVGGLDDKIQQLKEMIQLPLTYPEVFLEKTITPPRGVLFHGPPGTGKTLMARALAASCSSEGRKVTFYMRKGADCLSKWVGEAERQLTLLFEEAKNNQPSIIFFDEIDGKLPFFFPQPNIRNSLTRVWRRTGTCKIWQTRTDPCIHCFDAACSYGWNGWQGPSCCDWRNKSSRRG